MSEEARTYKTAQAFRRALEDRLKKISVAEKLDLQRLMREVAFDRLLARLFSQPEAPWVLKGGYALELRLKEARATRDLDLALRHTLGGKKGDPLDRSVLQALRQAALADLADHFEFVIGEPMAELAGAPYGGARFPVEARLDGRAFVRFHMDVGSGDVVLGPLDTTQGRDWLGFAGISVAKYPTISREQHFSEKVHAYTMPRSVPNTRVRDLVDMILLIQTGLDQEKTAAALAATFKRRGTHVLPKKLDAPPASWAEPFQALAKSCGQSPEIVAAFAEVEKFYMNVASAA